MKRSFRAVRFGILLFLSCFAVQTVLTQTTTFTYQGRFTDSTAVQPTNGIYEMEFKAFDAAVNGNQFATTVNLPSVRVINGIFTVSLDYGAQTFRGANVFLEISVRPSGSSNPLTILSPRQQFTSAPYAIQSVNSINALNAGDSANLGNIAANFYLLKNGDGSALTNVNAVTLGGFAANNFVTTADSRLTDARTPTAGSSFYIQNSNAVQSSANFNVGGNGTVGGTFSGNVVNAAAQFNIANARVLTVDASDNFFPGSCPARRSQADF